MPRWTSALKHCELLTCTLNNADLTHTLKYVWCFDIYDNNVVYLNIQAKTCTSRLYISGLLVSTLKNVGGLDIHTKTCRMSWHHTSKHFGFLGSYTGTLWIPGNRLWSLDTETCRTSGPVDLNMSDIWKSLRHVGYRGTNILLPHTTVWGTVVCSLIFPPIQSQLMLETEIVSVSARPSD